MDQEIARMCGIVKQFSCINPALELFFLLNSDRRFWGCGKPVQLSVQVTVNKRKQTRQTKTYSLRVTQADGGVITFSEPKEDTPNTLMFSASIIDLQHLIRRIAQKNAWGPAEVVSGVELGGRLDLWINGISLSRTQVMQVVNERLGMTDGLDRNVSVTIIKSQPVITDRVVIALDWRAIPRQVTVYNSEGAMLSSGQEILFSSINAYVNEFFAKYRSVKEITVIDSLTRANIMTKKRSVDSQSPPACSLSQEKMEYLTETLKMRKAKPSCPTMVRCLCKSHASCPFTVQLFFDSIIKAVGDVAMKRGDCPMCCVTSDVKSKKPLVRFTEEVDWALKSGHDWSDFQFRGMLFDMFPNAWVAVENTVYKDKNPVVSSGVINALGRACATEFGAEEVLTSNNLRPWTLYEMAISRSYGQRAHYIAMRYLDIAFGNIFLKRARDRLEGDSPIVKRILLSAAQLIPGGDCLLDDTSATEPHSRSESHVLGCLVSFVSPRTRVLAELLRTWASVEWNGDVASYLTSVFGEEFSKGALGYYFNSRRTKGVKVETVNGSLHVTYLSDRCEQRKKREQKRAAERPDHGYTHQYP